MDGCAGLKVRCSMLTRYDDYFELLRLAQALVIYKPDLDVLLPEYEGKYTRFPQGLQSAIRRMFSSGDLIIPDLRCLGNKSVGVFSDYGGEAKDSRYLTYSVLLCAFNCLEHFTRRMAEIRAEFRLGEKEISFKDLNMGQIRNSLELYLDALDRVPGLLVTIVVPKEMKSVFHDGSSTNMKGVAEILSSSGFGTLKPEVSEKLLRIVHTIAFFIGLLRLDGMKLFWMTDNDAVATSAEKHALATKLLGNVLGLYTKAGTNFPLLGGALPFKKKSVMMLDLLSAPDLAAGAIEQFYTRSDGARRPDYRLKPGCQLILDWLVRPGLALKKATIFLDSGEVFPHVQIAYAKISSSPPTAGQTVVPVFIRGSPSIKRTAGLT